MAAGCFFSRNPAFQAFRRLFLGPFDERYGEIKDTGRWAGSNSAVESPNLRNDPLRLSSWADRNNPKDPQLARFGSSALLSGKRTGC
jgi:hypothetical protein